MRTVVTAVAVAALLTGVAACSSSGSTAPSARRSSPESPAAAAPAPVRTAAGGVQVVTVHTTDGLRFVPSTIRVHVGTVRIDLVDDGSYPHDFEVPTIGAKSGTVTGGPGEKTTSLTLKLGTPGSYAFDCVYHAAAGMRGRLIVSG